MMTLGPISTNQTIFFFTSLGPLGASFIILKAKQNNLATGCCQLKPDVLMMMVDLVCRVPICFPITINNNGYYLYPV